MNRTRVLQEIRMMRFEEAYTSWQDRRLTLLHLGQEAPASGRCDGDRAPPGSAPQSTSPQAAGRDDDSLGRFHP